MAFVYSDTSGAKDPEGLDVHAENYSLRSRKLPKGLVIYAEEQILWMLFLVKCSLSCRDVVWGINSKSFTRIH